MRSARTTGKSADEPPCFTVPIRCTKPHKSRYKVNSAVIGDTFCYFSSLICCFDEAHLITKPLDHSARYEHRALKSISDLTIYAPADGGQQTVFALDTLITRIHQQKTACAVGVLNIAFKKTALSEKCSLLVACTAAYRYLSPNNIFIRDTKFTRTVTDLGQYTFRDTEKPQYLLVPLESMDIKKHRS